eukprot:21218-Heterococcus_DN1.PRE.2
MRSLAANTRGKCTRIPEMSPAVSIVYGIAAMPFSDLSCVGLPSTMFSHQALVGKLVCRPLDSSTKSPHTAPGQLSDGRSAASTSACVQQGIADEADAKLCNCMQVLRNEALQQDSSEVLLHSYTMLR